MKWLLALQALGLVLVVSSLTSARQTWRLASSGVVKQATVERATLYKGVQTVEASVGGATLSLQWPSSEPLPAVGATVELRVLPETEVAVPADAPPDWTAAVLLGVLGLAFVGVPVVVGRLRREPEPR